MTGPRPAVCTAVLCGVLALAACSGPVAAPLTPPAAGPTTAAPEPGPSPGESEAPGSGALEGSAEASAPSSGTASASASGTPSSPAPSSSGLPSASPSAGSTPGGGSSAELTTFSGTWRDVRYSFEYPSDWTVDDATLAVEPGDGTVSVSGPDGQRVASLDILLAWGASCSADGCADYPAHYLGDWAGQSPLSGSGPFVVRSMAVDLSDAPEELERNAWTDNVRVVTSLSSNTGAPPSSLVPALMYGIGRVETEAAAPNRDSQRAVLFIANRDFGTLREAQSYAGSEEHRQIQAMIASFRER